MPADTNAAIRRSRPSGTTRTTRGGWFVRSRFRCGGRKEASLQEAALAGLPILFPGLGAPYDGWETCRQAGSPSIPFPQSPLSQRKQAVGRFSLAATSLIPAIPAGLLCFFLVSAFLSNAENMSGTLQGVIAGSLLLAAAVIVMPVGILLFGGAKTAPAADTASTSSSDDDDELGVDDELLADDDDTEQNSLASDDDDSYAETVAYDSSAELEDMPAADSGDEIDFFDDEDDEK